VLVVSCALASHAGAFDVQGHRGARGLMPENTLAAFRTALTLGVDTIETDLAVTRDGVVVISHNPRLNPEITRGPDGQFLTVEGPPIHDLTLQELARYDVGRLNPQAKYAAQFPEQKPNDGERIPTLQALLDLVKSSGKPVGLNIETKIDPGRPDDTPAPGEFVRRVVEAVRASGVAQRVTIQSFDWRTLVEVKRIAPELRTACLTQETQSTNNVAPRDARASPWTAGLDLRTVDGSVPRLVKAAGCDIWSPYFRNATPARIEEAHALGLAVLPWTVNDAADMERLIDAGVDGLISDYPDRLRAIVDRRLPKR
jgi:glycerophosphoryl diester phosphodiesterase